MVSCLVTGGAGFIGSHLVEALVARGMRVRVLDDLSTGRVANLAAVQGKIETITASISDPQAVAAAVTGVDWVFHLAAIASVQSSLEDPLRTHDVCATGTLRVLEAARRAGVRRVIYAASASAYGPLASGAQRESDPLEPQSPYAAAKLAGEHYCQAFSTSYGLETVRLRFFNVFGPRQDPQSPYSGVIALFIAAMLTNKPVMVHDDGRQSRDFVYVADAVQALLKAAEAPLPGKVYNIGSGRSSTILELLGGLNAILGTAVVPIHGPARPGDVRHSLAAIDLATRDLNYHPSMSFADGLRATVDWYRREGPTS